MPVEVKSLSHIYMEGTPFEAKALSEVSMSVHDGEFIGIIGHTGSGKSTLISHLNGLELSLIHISHLCPREWRPWAESRLAKCVERCARELSHRTAVDVNGCAVIAFELINRVEPRPRLWKGAWPFKPAIACESVIELRSRKDRTRPKLSG